MSSGFARQINAAVGGDLSGDLPNPEVVGITGNPVQPTTLNSTNDGYVPTWVSADNLIEWLPSSGGGGGGGFTAGQDLSGTSTAQTVIGVQDTLISNTPSEGGDGSFLGVATSGTSLEWLPAFTAGQDLSGTATSQTVIGIQDYTISNSPEPGYSLVVATSGATLEWQAGGGGGGINYTQPPPTDVGSYLPYQPGSSEDFYTLLNEITGNPYVGFSEVSVATLFSGVGYTGPSDYTIVGANIAVAESGTYVSGTGVGVAAITFIGDALAQIRAFTSQTTQSGGNQLQIENPEGASIQINGNGLQDSGGQLYGLDDIEFTGGMTYWSQCFVDNISNYYVDSGGATSYLSNQERYDGSTVQAPIDDYIINVSTTENPVTIYLSNGPIGNIQPKRYIINDVGGNAENNIIEVDGDIVGAFSIQENYGSLTFQAVWINGGLIWQAISQVGVYIPPPRTEANITKPSLEVNANYTTVAGEDYIIYVDTLGAAIPIIITLDGVGEGVTYIIKDVSGAASLYPITVVDGSDTPLLIDGSLTYVINLNYAAISFSAVGNDIVAAGWAVTGSYNGTVI